MKSRQDIADMLGINKVRLVDLLVQQRMVLPDVVLKSKNVMFYDDKAVDDFIKSDPLNREKSLVIKGKKLEGLDNELAVKFLTRHKVEEVTFASLSNKHRKKGCQTTTIHIEECHPLDVLSERYVKHNNVEIDLYF